MLLYDIGNSSIKCYSDGKIFRVAAVAEDNPFYYINVKPQMKATLEGMTNGVDLSPHFKLQTGYQGMGVDRVACCYAVDDGIIVDAGSAITVDVMENGVHKGGFILPGIHTYKESFATISSALIFDINEDIDLKSLPQNTEDALNFALFKSTYLMIKEVSSEREIYFTGGDGKSIHKFFKNSVYQEDLIFEGMKKVIKEMKC